MLVETIIFRQVSGECGFQLQIIDWCWSKKPDYCRWVKTSISKRSVEEKTTFPDYLVISPTWELFFATLRPGGHIRGHVIFYLHGVEFQESASRALLSVLVCVADCTPFHASLSTRPSEVFERHLLSPSTDTLKKLSVNLPPPSWKGPERGDKTTKLLCGQLRQLNSPRGWIISQTRVHLGAFK